MILIHALALATLATFAVQPGAAPTPPAVTATLADLPIQQQTALRCAVAVAMATELQRSGKAAVKGWPDLQANNRGREFFVRSMARLMDDTGLSREALALRGRVEVGRLQEAGALDAVMPPCALLVDAAGL